MTMKPRSLLHPSKRRSSSLKCQPAINRSPRVRSTRRSTEAITALPRKETIGRNTPTPLLQTPPTRTDSCRPHTADSRGTAYLESSNKRRGTTRNNCIAKDPRVASTETNENDIFVLLF